MEAGRLLIRGLVVRVDARGNATGDGTGRAMVLDVHKYVSYEGSKTEQLFAYGAVISYGYQTVRRQKKRRREYRKRNQRYSEFSSVNYRPCR